MEVLLQFQADQLGVPVARPELQETTVAGAAYLAGLAEGVWAAADLAGLWQLDRRFEPDADRTDADARFAKWGQALARSRAWA
jgi:glycerol kinase